MERPTRASASGDRRDGPSLYWYDLETFGLDPARDRVAQFAGVRTDLDLNVLGEPDVLYCKPPLDYLPDPRSCLVTGITPQFAHQRGLVEAEFVAAIRKAFLHPGTCVVGYNNLRFDDEVLRYAQYRNLFDPYEREWRNGNSRWDIIDMIRLVAALRPGGLAWPKTEEGRTSFRLELLTSANEIPHVGAHDALSDVRATIALARLIKLRQPRLYHYVFSHRGKREAAGLIEIGAPEPVVHVSGRFSGEHQHLALVHALVRHPGNQNGIIVYDLDVDPAPLIELDAVAIRARLFTAAEEGVELGPRVPLKTVHLNKCPVLAPIGVLRSEDAARLSLDLEKAQRHLDRLRSTPGLAQKVASVFEPPDFPAESDTDVLLYRGGFLGEADRQQLNRVHELPPERLGADKWEFHDGRLAEMLHRFRARNYPETLTDVEREQWEAWRSARLNGSGASGVRTLADFMGSIAELGKNLAADSPESAILRDLEDYGRSVSSRNPGFLTYT